jgi:hypothetical protein
MGLSARSGLERAAYRGLNRRVTIELGSSMQ